MNVSPVNRAERNEIDVFYRFVNNEIVLSHLENMSQKDEIPLSVPLRILLLLLINYCTILRRYAQFNLSLSHFRVPDLVKTGVGQSQHSYIRRKSQKYL